jgi:hypothetical protein
VGQPKTAINIEYNSRRERSLLQELSFGAWGDRRNPATWRSFTGTPPEPLFDRGFTGHVKHNCRIVRNYLKGQIRDKINALMAAAGFNFRRLLRKMKA